MSPTLALERTLPTTVIEARRDRLSPPDRFGPPYVRLKRSARLMTSLGSVPAILPVTDLQDTRCALRFDFGEACRPNALDAEQILDRPKRLDPTHVDDLLCANRTDVDDFL